MVKRKRTIKRKTTRGRIVQAKRRRKSISNNPMKSYLGGLGYGIFRGKASDFVNSNIANRLPFGNYSDEVAFTGISYLMAKYGKKVLGVDMKNLGKSGLIVEGALMGSQTADLIPFGNFGGVTPKVQNKSIGYAS